MPQFKKKQGATAKNGPQTTVLQPKKGPKMGQNRAKRQICQKKNWSFRAKNWPKIAKKKKKKKKNKKRARI